MTVIESGFSPCAATTTTEPLPVLFTNVEMRLRYIGHGNNTFVAALPDSKRCLLDIVAVRIPDNRIQLDTLVPASIVIVLSR